MDPTAVAKDGKCPDHCIADFCLIPMGIDGVSVSRYIADIQRVLKASGLKYYMHGNGTTVEGSWTDVTAIIGKCHSMLHDQGVVRCHTDIRIGSRTDKSQTHEDKVKSVERLLGIH